MVKNVRLLALKFGLNQSERKSMQVAARPFASTCVSVWPRFFPSYCRGYKHGAKYRVCKEKTGIHIEVYTVNDIKIQYSPTTASQLYTMYITSYFEDKT